MTRSTVRRFAWAACGWLLASCWPAAALADASGARLKKRVAVMPVTVGRLAAELAMPPDFVAAKVRDATETQLAHTPGLVIVNRSRLGDVVNEQRLSQSGAFDRGLAPAPRRLIPAQVLLYVTVDQLQVVTSIEEQSRSDAEARIRRAQELDRIAVEADNRARDTEDRLTFSGAAPTPDPVFTDCAAQWNCAQYPQPHDWCLNMVRQCEGNNRLRQQMHVADRQRALAEEQERLLEDRQRTRSYEAQAEALRREAALATTSMSRRERRSGQISLVWRAIDSTTGAVVASGVASGTGQLQESSSGTRSSYRSSMSGTSRPTSNLIDLVLAKAIGELSLQVDGQLGSEPFRAMVAKVEGERVILNAGVALGVRVDDLFGVRATRDLVTDPATGLALTTPGAPTGILHVTEVHPEMAVARIVRGVDRIERGDELEWLGNGTP